MNVIVKKQVILKPVFSEKSLDEYKKNKVCSFWVNPDSTKAEIEKEFNVMFGIKPAQVNVVVKRENNKYRRSKKAYWNSTNRKYVKKAHINIGDNTLDIFENIR